MKNRGKNGVRAYQSHEADILPVCDLEVLGSLLDIELLVNPQDEGWPEMEENQ